MGLMDDFLATFSMDPRRSAAQDLGVLGARALPRCVADDPHVSENVLVQ